MRKESTFSVVEWLYIASAMAMATFILTACAGAAYNKVLQVKNTGGNQGWFAGDSRFASIFHSAKWGPVIAIGTTDANRSYPFAVHLDKDDRPKMQVSHRGSVYVIDLIDLAKRGEDRSIGGTKPAGSALPTPRELEGGESSPQPEIESIGFDEESIP